MLRRELRLLLKRRLQQAELRLSQLTEAGWTRLHSVARLSVRSLLRKQFRACSCDSLNLRRRLRHELLRCQRLRLLLRRKGRLSDRLLLDLKSRLEVGSESRGNVSQRLDCSLLLKSTCKLMTRSQARCLLLLLDAAQSLRLRNLTSVSCFESYD